MIDSFALNLKTSDLLVLCIAAYLGFSNIALKMHHRSQSERFSARLLITNVQHPSIIIVFLIIIVDNIVAFTIGERKQWINTVFCYDFILVVPLAPQTSISFQNKNLWKNKIRIH